jgi:hypothetical protein
MGIAALIRDKAIIGTTLLTVLKDKDALATLAQEFGEKKKNLEQGKSVAL